MLSTISATVFVWRKTPGTKHAQIYIYVGADGEYREGGKWKIRIVFLLYQNGHRRRTLADLSTDAMLTLPCYQREASQRPLKGCVQCGVPLPGSHCSLIACLHAQLLPSACERPHDNTANCERPHDNRMVVCFHNCVVHTRVKRATRLVTRIHGLSEPPPWLPNNQGRHLEHHNAYALVKYGSKSHRPSRRGRTCSHRRSAT